MARSGNKGLELEELLKAYFWQAGYFVVRGVPYRLEGEDVTDVDLWLYERPAALTRRRLIVDVKNRKSPKVAERIIWAKGLQVALGVDGAVVATTDKRPSARKLSRALQVTLLDGDAVGKLMQSDLLSKTGRISSEELDRVVLRIDKGRFSAEWRQTLHDARASLISDIGVQSTNTNLRANAFFAQQAVLAQPGSEQAQVAVRLFYLTAAFAAISLDYVLADQVFRSQDERRQAVINGIRFGESDSVAAMPTIRAAIGLAQKYVRNGAAIAKQIEYGFYLDADRIPAEIIADHVSRVATSDGLFNVARDIERAAFSTQLPSYDQMGVAAKSLLGVFLDFNGVSREKLALAWSTQFNPTLGGKPLSDKQETGSLFSESEEKAQLRPPAAKVPGSR